MSDSVNNFYKKTVNGKKGNVFTRLDALEERLRKRSVFNIEQVINNVTGSSTEVSGQLQTILTDSKDPTGWLDPDAAAAALTYDSATQKITLTGTHYYYWRGVKSSVTDFVSTAHTNTAGHIYYLSSSDGQTFTWATDTVWTFDVIMLASVNYQTAYKYGFAETHGLMQWQVHEELHRTIGTFKESGGTLDAASYALASTTAADRRPDVVQTRLHDEDIDHVLDALTSKAYNKFSLSSSNTVNFSGETAEIIAVTGAQPSYNLFTTPNWTQQPMTANTYTCVWLVAQPTTHDANSETFRYFWVQGQSAGTLVTQNALTPSDVNLGALSEEAEEFVFLVKIVVNYQSAGGGNWVITSVTDLSGNHFSQIGAAAVGYLSSVSTDATLTGDGTLASPLSVVTGGGVGDVIGDSVPSVAGNVAVYTDTTGKHIEDSGANLSLSAPDTLIVGAHPAGTVTGSNNIFVTSVDGFLLSSGSSNVAIGADALYQTNGDANVAVGDGALGQNPSGSNNIAVGNQAGSQETGSGKLLIDAYPRTDEAEGRAGAILYGEMNADPSLQELTVNGNLTVTGTITPSGGTPGGADTQVQYNDGGAFGGAKIGYTEDATSTNLSTEAQGTLDTAGYDLDIWGSTGNGTGNGGNINLYAGNTEGGENAGGFTLSGGVVSGKPASSFLIGASSSDGDGGDFIFGAGNATGDNSGGDVIISPGAKSGTGNDGLVKLLDATTGNKVIFDPSGLSADHTFAFPNADGTLALTSDIPTAYTDEMAQDAVGGMVADTATIDLTYTDATPELKADVKDGSITYAKMQDVSATSRILGRITALAGDVEELTGANVRTIANVADGAQVNVLEGVTGTAPIVAGAIAAKSQAISITAASGAAAGSMSAAHYTKLEGAAPTASPTFTGTVILPKAIEIQDTSADHQYVLAVSELTADRTVTLPLLTGADTFVFAAHAQTFTNKRVTPRTGTVASSGTPTINTDTVDYFSITALAANITSMTTNLSGTPTAGQKLWIAITGTAARTIAWGTSFEASTIALPTTTVTTARLDVGFVWNEATSKWRCVGVA